MNIAIIVLTAVATIISAYVQIKTQRDQAILIGWVLLPILVLIASLSVFQHLNSQQLAYESAHRLRNNDFRLRIDASILGMDRENYLEASPDSLSVTLINSETSTMLQFLLKPLPGFVSMGYSRGMPTHTRIYLTENVVFKNGTAIYLWDLDDTELLGMRNPRLEFSGVSSGEIVHDWKIQATLQVQGRKFAQSNEPDSYSLLFVLTGIAK